MNVGLLTYHAAYNFGSVLQAYATQQAIESSGNHCVIVNYRPKSQKKYYSLYPRFSHGLTLGLKDVLLWRHFSDLRERAQKYEAFISDYMNITEEFANPDDAYAYSECFDIVVCGSDQIWNKYSHELHNTSWRYMEPYLAAFTNKKKISFASSIGAMTEGDIKNIKKFLSEFYRISCRERESATILSQITGLSVENVVDPSFLLERNEWEQIARESVYYKINKKYILYYSLRGSRMIANDLRSMLPYANKNNLEIISLSPLSPLPKIEGVISLWNVGPIDFLALVFNAKRVISNSYHGTIFSIIFRKDFASNACKNNRRICDALDKFGLAKRRVNKIADTFSLKKCDYTEAEKKINIWRNKSIEYLISALGD